MLRELRASRVLLHEMQGARSNSHRHRQTQHTNHIKAMKTLTIGKQCSVSTATCSVLVMQTAAAAAAANSLLPW